MRYRLGIRCLAMVMGLLFLCTANAFGEAGDVDGSGITDIKDAVVALQIGAGFTMSVNKDADVNGDGKIGTEEAVYVLQYVTGLIQPPLILPTKTFEESNLSFSFQDETGNVSFLKAEDGYAIAQPVALPVSATSEDAARSFLSVYGSAFGIEDQSADLNVIKTSAAGQGRNFVRFQQKYGGIPILGGELIIQMDSAKNVMSVSAEILGNADVSALSIYRTDKMRQRTIRKISARTVPDISGETARQIVLAKVAEIYSRNIGELNATSANLMIYNPLLLGFSEPDKDMLVWHTEINPADFALFSEFVLVDANSGEIVLNFNQIDSVKNRLTYNAQNGTNLPGVLCRMEGQGNSTDSDCNKAHDYAGDTYDFYSREHGRDGIDNAGMNMISTVRYDSDYCNAFWNGSQMTYGDGCGIVVDDVVAHEMTHGVTSHESDLIYLNQSGAINESFSDIWGEFVDQTNGKGTDTPEVKWKMGEDITGVGAFRDLKDPTFYNDPDRITSSLYYCGSGDRGGVHTNSGVGNKVAYLITDGGSFNGYTVKGLGYAKVADLFYEVQTRLLTSAANYADLYDALILACSNLGYGSDDCIQVKNALMAVEMNLKPCQPQQCTNYSISPTSQSFDSNGWTDIVDVTAQSGCSWTAKSNDYWISITSGSSGNGDGTVNYRVSENTGTSSRTGTMIIAGKIFTIIQSSPPQNIKVIFPNGGEKWKKGEIYTITWEPANPDNTVDIFLMNPEWGNFGYEIADGISNTGSYSWTVNNEDWLFGDDYYQIKIFLRINSNISSEDKSDDYFSISCAYSLSPSNSTFTSDGGTGSVSLTAQSGCSWTAVSNNTAWITVTSGSSGSSNGTVNYQVSENTGTSSRTGTITIAGKTFTVTQSAPVVCTYSISPTSKSFQASGGAGSVSLSTSSGCEWTAKSNDSWITINSGTSGSSNGTVSYSIASCSEEDTRTGTLTIAGQIFTVTQNGCSQTGGVFGYVIDSMTDPTIEQPIVGADVNIGGKSGKTNNAGYYYIPDIPVGNQTRTISKTGYEHYVGTVTIYAGKNTDGGWTFLTPIDEQKPDLIVQNASVSPTTITSDSEFSVSCTVKNQGGGIAAESSLHYYLSKDAAYDSGDKLLGKNIISMLYSGESESESLYLSIPSDTSAGQWYILFGADAYEEVNESNENNNVNSYPITVWIDDQVRTLTSGESQTGSVSYRQWRYYEIDASASHGEVKIEVTNIGSTMLDLCVLAWVKPEFGLSYDYDCHLYDTTGNIINPKICTVNNYGDTKWYIGIYGSESGDFTIKATLIPITTKPEMISPVPGSALSSSEVTFTWTPASNTDKYKLDVGTYKRGDDIFWYMTSDTSMTVSGLPTDGSTIYVTLFYRLQGESSFYDPPIEYTYSTGSSGINLPDKNLEAAIREKIGKPTGNITVSDLQGLTGVLYANSRSIQNIEGIQYCMNLSRLNLNTNQINDLSPLASLTNLEELYLKSNQISNISALAGLTNLETLLLGHNSVSNITALSGLTQLTRLELHSNQISDISPLMGLNNLDELTLGGIRGTEWLGTNPLSSTSCNTYIPQLESRGVTVYDNCP